MLCCWLVVYASLTDGWVACEYYFFPNDQPFANDPGPFGWDRIVRDFPWNPRVRPWTSAVGVAILGISISMSANATKISWLKFCILWTTAIAYHLWPSLKREFAGVGLEIPFMLSHQLWEWPSILITILSSLVFFGIDDSAPDMQRESGVP